MDPAFIQTLRYKLQRRIRRLNGIDTSRFGMCLAHTWPFIRNNNLFMGILEPVLRHRADLEESANNIVSGQNVMAETELESVGIAFHVLDKTVQAEQPQHAIENVGFSLDQCHDVNDAVNAYRELFLEPVYEYLDEQLDGHRATCALLVKYKHRAEWFARTELQALSTQGERRLAEDLYRYLHDQGMQFHIEPQSTSGEVDLVADQTGEERLVLDAKLFDGDSKGRAYLVTGFNQVYTYARDYNQSAAYLAIYQTAPVEPKFTFATSDSIFPYIEHNGKIIYFVVVDICDYNKPASKRGQCRVVEITRDHLIGSKHMTEENR